MDNSELRYVDYDPETTWDEMMKTYNECGGDVLYPGDEKEILLRSVLAIATAIMAKVDSALRMDTLTYATGEYLKEYGLKRNCVYIDAVPATAPVTITFEGGWPAKIMEAGTAFTADGSIIYTLKDAKYITGTNQVMNAVMECAEAGTIGNGLRSGTELQPVESIEGFIRCVVTADASGGTDAEDEEVYRERIRNFGLNSVTTGPSALYEAQARSVSTQIVDARAVNIRDGNDQETGTVGIYLLLAEGADAPSLCASVEQKLSAETTRPLTDRVVVAEADAVEYTLEVKVWYSQYSGIGDAVTDAINEYQEWQDNRIGRAWDPNKLTAMLYQAGCERVQYLTGSKIGEDGPVEYTEIPDDSHCSGTINLTVVNT